MSFFSLLGAVEIGLIFSLVALGVFISFRLLRSPDLTVDGSFPLGGAVCAILISTGTNAWVATLAATADDANGGIAELRSRVQASLSHAKDGLIDAQAAVVDKAKAAAKATDGYVHDNPWKSVSVAAGVGLLLGILIGRR